ncbi:MAG: acetaldehyde dehydrogenase (acetylating) [Gammaproteobacteria bacterium RIFCSPHIGHO2_12_FULL_42_10]|nr:MAG: acetaldehyde dehydrogenase (acetylating) [Gammaproteobacteria bacterium RIFCSPHIGHO2_12_FULL_42_10]
MNQLKVAILGSGNIGTDLLIKVTRSPYLQCNVFIGRNLASPGIMKARSLNVQTSADGIAYIVQHPACCEIVFDATSATAHQEHAPILKTLNKFVIDLTPAKIGILCVPVVNITDCLKQMNINMITCGGQAAVPIAHALAMTHHEIDYIETISNIASRSAGRATRLNIDEYIHTTEAALKSFTGAKITKAILNLNPAQPCIHMQTTVFAKVKNPQIEKLRHAVGAIAEQIQRYVPGYAIIVPPMIENDRIVVMVRVKGLGDYLPEYAGNLDIINCAALALAEAYAKTKLHPPQKEKAHEICFAQ